MRLYDTCKYFCCFHNFFKVWSTTVYSILFLENYPQLDVFLREFRNSAIYNSVVGAIIVILSYVATVLMNISAFNQVYRIRQEYLKTVLNQDFPYFDTHKTGDFASKMTDDVVKLENGIGEKLATFIFYQTSFISYNGIDQGLETCPFMLDFISSYTILSWNCRPYSIWDWLCDYIFNYIVSLSVLLWTNHLEWRPKLLWHPQRPQSSREDNQMIYYQTTIKILIGNYVKDLLKGSEECPR